MIHVLVSDWTKAGEAVKGLDIVELKAYRVKMTDGSYKIVLADHKPRSSGNPGHLVSEPEPDPEPIPRPESKRFAPKPGPEMESGEEYYALNG